MDLNVDHIMQPALQKPVNPQDYKRIEETATEFEAVFIAEMLKPMFEGISTAPPFGGGKGEEVFRSFLLQEYGKNIARNHSLGVADFVKSEMIKIQEQTNDQR